MSSVVGTDVRKIRVNVESVDVEIDEEGLLWTSLQTAFPGCSGMYYQDANSTCRSAVKFDGKKFLPPGGHWNDREYFVTLSQKCHANGNVNNYEHATKQFERNVHAVQRLFAASKIDLGHLRVKKEHRERVPALETVVPTMGEPTGRTETTSPVQVADPIHSIQERSSLLQASGRELTPIEQQFVDLAKISTAKDSIIDAHRAEINKLNAQIINLQKELRGAEIHQKESEIKMRAQEEELQLYREMGKKYGDTVEKKKEYLATSERLAKELQEQKTEFEKKLDEAKEKIDNLANENKSLQEKLAVSDSRTAELEEQLQMNNVTKDLLSKELDQLRPLAETAGIVDLENVKTYVEAIAEAEKVKDENKKVQKQSEDVQEAFNSLQLMHVPMCEMSKTLRNRFESSEDPFFFEEYFENFENKCLRNDELEERVSKIDEELRNLNEEWASTLKEKQDEWTKLKKNAEEEVSSLRVQMIDLQQILETALKSANEKSRRLEELNIEKQEMMRIIETSEIKSQESDNLHRKVRTLTDQLGEAEKRVSELTHLVASLANDAHNSRRDISDIL